MLFYPFGYDQAAFSVGGDMILRNGAVPFRDFLDTKPPFIFYLYSTALFVFGHHDWSIRAFDALFHFAALYYFYHVLLNLLQDKDTAILSCFLYVILYTSSGYWATAQAETFAIIPSIAIFYHSERFLSGKGKIYSNAIAIGVFAMVLFFLKSTLMMVPLASFTCIFLYGSSQKKLQFIGVSIAVFILASGIYLCSLVYTGAFGMWIESLQWVREYANISPLFSFATIRKVYFQLFPAELLGSITPSFLILSAFAIYTMLSTTKKNDPQRTVYTHLLFQVVLGLAAVLLERKCFPYHYSRIFWAIVPFTAIGVLSFWQFIKNSLHNNYSLRNRVLLCVFVCVAIFYSPLMRVLSQPFRWTYMSVTQSDIKSLVQSEHGSYPLRDQQTLADRYKDMAGAGDVFFWGNHVGIYFYLNALPTTIVLTNTPLVTNWTPQHWRDSVITQLQRKPTKLFITEQRDYASYINATELDSWGTLNRWTELREYLDSNYMFDDSVGTYLVFKRKTSS